MKEGDNGGSADGLALNDEGSQSCDVRVTVIETVSGKTLSGEDAPTASQLQAFLDEHPGWELAPREDDGSDDDVSDGDDSPDESDTPGQLVTNIRFNGRKNNCLC